MMTNGQTRDGEPDDRLAEAIDAFEAACDAGANPGSADWLRRWTTSAISTSSVRNARP